MSCNSLITAALAALAFAGVATSRTKPPEGEFLYNHVNPSMKTEFFAPGAGQGLSVGVKQ